MNTDPKSILQNIPKHFFTKKKIILGGILLVGIGAYFFYPQKAEIITETIRVEKTDIIATQDIDGRLEHASSLSLSFGMNGKIVKQRVKEGDMVQAGDALAEMETKDLILEIEKAKINKAIAVANLQARLAGTTVEDITIAKKNGESAVLEKENTKNQNTLAITSAKITLEQAENKLETAKSGKLLSVGTQDLDTQTAQRNIITAEQNLEIAKKNAVNNSERVLLDQKQAYEKASVEYLSSLSNIDSSLREGYLILEIDKNPGYGMGYLYSGSNESLRRQAADEYLKMKTLFENTKNADIPFDPAHKTEILGELQTRIDLLRTMQSFLGLLSEGYNYSITSNTLSSDRISTLKNTLLSKENTLTAQINSILTVQQRVESAELTIQTTQLSDANAITLAEQKLSDAIANASKVGSTQSESLLQTDDSVFGLEKQVETAKAQYENAVQKASIAENIADTKIAITQAQISALQNGVRPVDTQTLKEQIKNADVMIKQAQMNVEDAKIIAPTSGRIVQKNYDDGDFVQNGATAKPVFILVSENQFEITASVDEAEILSLTEGQRAEISFDALEDKKLSGVLTFISSLGNLDANGVVTYEVIIQVENPENLPLKEGMTAYASVIVEERKNVLAIPSRAIQNDTGKSTVTKQDGSEVKISTGLTDGKKVEILSGLKEGDEIIVKK